MKILIKYAYLILFVLIADGLPAQLKWVRQKSNTNTILTYVDFLNKDTGIVVGYSGTILSTYNGGKTWSRITNSYSNDLSSVEYVDNDYVYASGSGGLVIKSTNGGQTWSKLNTGLSSMLYTVNFIDRNTGFAAGLNGEIIKTTDGGASWFRQNSGTSSHIYRIQFLSKDTGYVAANDGVVLRTFNGGNTWTLLNTRVSQRLHYLNFIDSKKGFACGDYGVLVSTNDYGNTWTKLSSGTNNLLNCVKIIDHSSAYIVGEGGIILKTKNNGNTWVDDNSGISTRLVSVCFPEKNVGYAVGLNGEILKQMPDSIEIKYCVQDSTASLTAPQGFESYAWSDATGKQIGTERILVVKNLGTNETYSCRLTIGTITDLTLKATLKAFVLSADFSFDYVNCENNIIRFRNKSQASESPVSYKWNFGDGTTSDQENPVHTYSQQGKWIISLEINSALSSCPDTISKIVDVYAPMKVEIIGDSLCCKGYTLTMRASGADSYIWSDGSTADTLIVNENSGRIWVIGIYGNNVCRSDTVFKTIKSAQYQISVSGYKTFCPDLSTTITATGAKDFIWSNGTQSDSVLIAASGGDFWVVGKTEGGCYSDTLFFSVYEEPDWDFSIAGQMRFCHNDSTQISVNGSVSNRWFDNSTGETIFITKPGNYIVSGFNSRGCEKQLNFSVTESELPNTDFVKSVSVVDRKNNVLTVSVNPEPETDYVWEMGDGSLFSGVTHTHSYNVRNNQIEYIIRLSATNKFGCVSFSEQSVDVVPFIPNVFSPNHDGVNDIFVPDVDVMIIDRYGKTLYRGAEGWDGTFSGREAPQDTYFYYVYYTDKYGKVQTRKGSVTLIRQ